MFVKIDASINLIPTFLSMKIKTWALLCLQLLAVAAVKAQGVKLIDNGDKVTLQNKLVSFTFSKNSNIAGIGFKNYTNLLGAKGRAYLLGPGFSMGKPEYRVVQNTPEVVEIVFDNHAQNHFEYDLHYVLTPNVAGVYCFLIQSHKGGDPVGSYGQTRWGISADPGLFDYHLVRDSIQGPMPQMEILDEGEKVQDWTYKLPDGSIYTKYDYADYIEGRHVHGMAGQRSGLGLFVIQASHEYLDGGPTKQYQDVHAGPFLINMFNCGHFLSDIRHADDQIGDDWQKLCGPFLLYVNKGKDVPEVWNDAKLQAQKEIKQWPYTWMKNDLYPLQRGTVKGTIALSSGAKFANAHIILAAPGYDWQAQTRGYIFGVRTDANGNFELKNVRAGDYTLYAYGGDVTEEYSKAAVTVKEGQVTDLGAQTWTPAAYGDKLWQIGIADRRTTGFKLAEHKRQYGLFNDVPADLNFTIGKSNEANDWYYAQTKSGQWNILFNVDKSYTANATLTFAIAGAAKKPNVEVWVNNKLAGTLNNMGNDASVYRSAVAGGYYQRKQITFPSNLLAKGQNTMALKLVNVKDGGGVMYDAIKLEAQ